MRVKQALEDNGPAFPLSGLYAHVPFCRERCTYCSFTTIADDRALHAPLVHALLEECARHSRAGAFRDAPLRSLYLGGGTPGLLAPDDLAMLVDGLRIHAPLASDAEFTLEVNPANVSTEALKCWNDLGINRLSIGVQTFRDDVLSRLGRRHDATMARRALKLAHEHWPHTWSADLLVGWVRQQHDDLDRDIVELMSHAPPHVSVYGLTIEPKTPLAQLAASGHEVTAPTALLPAFDAVWSAALCQAGLERYEVSNFARDGHRSRHNQLYWRNLSYLGLGPGASSSVHPWRWTNRTDLAGYLRATANGRGVRAAAERVGPHARLLETVSCGLRTQEGLESAELDRRFGPAWRDTLAGGWQRLCEHDILRESRGWITVRPAEVVRLDAILRELISLSTSRGASTPGHRSLDGCL